MHMCVRAKIKLILTDGIFSLAIIALLSAAIYELSSVIARKGT